MGDPVVRALGDLLSEAREAKQLTQGAVAAALGSERGVVGRWERGEAVPRRRTRQALAALLDIPPADLESAAANAAKDASAATDAEADDAAGDAGPLVTLSALDYGKIIGRLELTAEWLGSLDHSITALHAQSAAVGESLQSLRAQLGKATSGVVRLVEGGGLPGVASVDDAHRAMDTVLARVRALEAELRAERARTTAAPSPGAGDGGGDDARATG